MPPTLPGVEPPQTNRRRELPETHSHVFQTPIAFLVFNRPELTARVWAAIAEVKPATLLIVGDGPRTDRIDEAERVALVRACVQRVDWPCDVRTNFSPVNLGCRQRIASGLAWVFQSVEEAIILEDDCLPDKHSPSASNSSRLELSRRPRGLRLSVATIFSRACAGRRTATTSRSTFTAGAGRLGGKSGNISMSP